MNGLSKVTEFATLGFAVIERSTMAVAAAASGNHAVVLASNIRTTFSKLSSPVSMDVFTWGGTNTLPNPGLPTGVDDGRSCRVVPMTLEKFLNYYYGYTAAKY